MQGQYSDFCVNVFKHVSYSLTNKNDIIVFSEHQLHNIVVISGG